MSRLLAHCACFAAALALSFAAAAQQYKWTDKDGRVQYGDAPPPGVKATPMRPQTGAPAPAAPAGAKAGTKGPLTPAEQEAAFRQRQQNEQKQEEKSEKADRDAAQKKDQCARAQEYQRSLESGVRQSRTDDKGERYFLEEAQIAQELSRARQMAEQVCN